MQNKILEIIKDKIFQWSNIDPCNLEFSEDVLDACRANHCGKYGTNWCCGPAAGDINHNKQIVNHYKNCLVFTTVGMLEDSFDIEGMDAARAKHQELLRSVKKQLSLAKIKVCGAGGCELCEKCTYPLDICKKPDESLVAIEAMGIDVVRLAKVCKINYHNSKNTVTYFGMILF